MHYLLSFFHYHFAAPWRAQFNREPRKGKKLDRAIVTGENIFYREHRYCSNTVYTRWDQSISFVRLCIRSSVHLLAHSTLWHISLVGAFICSDLHVWLFCSAWANYDPFVSSHFHIKKNHEELTVKPQIRVLNSSCNFVHNPSP